MFESGAKVFKYSFSADVPVSADKLFTFLDDQRNISSHMEKSSWMMAGSSMSIELDEREGKAIGSVIIMRGAMMGLSLFVKEAVCERNPPTHKAWETVGEQKLVILDQYKMGFDIASKGIASQLTVFIEYTLPRSGGARLLGNLFGNFYARWCTEKMVKDAVHHFSKAS